jgi:hypothetical protein
MVLLSLLALSLPGCSDTVTDPKSDAVNTATNLKTAIAKESAASDTAKTEADAKVAGRVLTVYFPDSGSTQTWSRNTNPRRNGM